MKNVLKYVFVSMTVISLTSAINYEDFNSKLIGTWEAATVERSGCEENTSNGTIALSCPEFCIKITFDGGLFVESYKDADSDVRNSNGTYTATGTTITMCDNGEPCSNIEYVIENDKLIFTTLEDTGCQVVTTFVKSK